MSSLIVVMPVTADPQLVAWLASHGVAVAGGQRASRYPTWDEVIAAVRELAPAEVHVHDRDGAKRRIDVLFGPVETRSSGAPHYAGGGFEISADIQGAAELSSLSFRGGTLEHVYVLSKGWSHPCGPLLVVHASYGAPAIVSPHTSAAEFESRLLGTGGST